MKAFETTQHSKHTKVKLKVSHESHLDTMYCKGHWLHYKTMIYNNITHNRPQSVWVEKPTNFLWLTIDSWLFTTRNALPLKVLSKSQGFILVGMHGALATLTSLSLVFSTTFVRALIFIMATTI